MPVEIFFYFIFFFSSPRYRSGMNSANPSFLPSSFIPCVFVGKTFTTVQYLQSIHPERQQAILAQINQPIHKQNANIKSDFAFLHLILDQRRGLSSEGQCSLARLRFRITRELSNSFSLHDGFFFLLPCGCA